MSISSITAAEIKALAREMVAEANRRPILAGIDLGQGPSWSVEVIHPKPPAEGLTLTSANRGPLFLPARDLTDVDRASVMAYLEQYWGEKPEPYAPGWRPGHLKRGRMTSLAWAVVSG